MVRTIFIQKKVLELYETLDKIQYPLEPLEIFQTMPDCRAISYAEAAELTDSSEEDVARACQSHNAATHYDSANQRYLVMYNQNMPSGRLRWTLLHEMGHIRLGHFETLGAFVLAARDERQGYRQLEYEADCFAWNAIAPLPILRELNISSAAEIQRRFGLSAEAAENQFERLQKWSYSHRKTCIENDFKKLFRLKGEWQDEPT